MIFWALLDPAGLLPERLGSSPVLPKGAIVLPAGLTPAEAAKCQHFEGQWWPRPYSPAAELLDGVIRIVRCPAGAKVVVEDLELRELLAEVAPATDTIEITLPDPGRYRVTVDFGAPYLPSITDIEVLP